MILSIKNSGINLRKGREFSFKVDTNLSISGLIDKIKTTAGPGFLENLFGIESIRFTMKLDDNPKKRAMRLSSHTAALWISSLTLDIGGGYIIHQSFNAVPPAVVGPYLSFAAVPPAPVDIQILNRAYFACGTGAILTCFALKYLIDDIYGHAKSERILGGRPTV